MSWNETGVSFLEYAAFLQDVGVTGKATFTEPPVLPTYTLGTVPDPTMHTNSAIILSDAPGGQTLATSDGTNWLTTASPTEMYLQDIVNSAALYIEIDLSSYITNYHSFRLEIRGVQAPANTSLYMQFGYNGGADWYTDDDYTSHELRSDNNNIRDNDNRSNVRITSDRHIDGGEYLSADIDLMDFSDNDTMYGCHGHSMYNRNNKIMMVRFMGGYNEHPATAIDAVRFYWSSSQNFTLNGTIKLYGKPNF